MQEINHARQESTAKSGKRKEYRCRVCHRPVEWPDLVCRKCWQRNREEQEWESYLDFLDGNDTTPGNREPPNRDGCKRIFLVNRPCLLLSVNIPIFNCFLSSSVDSLSSWFSRWILFSMVNGLFWFGCDWSNLPEPLVFWWFHGSEFGTVYWYLLKPIHSYIFDKIINKLAEKAEQA